MNFNKIISIFIQNKIVIAYTLFCFFFFFAMIYIQYHTKVCMQRVNVFV